MEIAKIAVRLDQDAKWNAKARIYFWPEGETLMENLQNRRQRPYTAYRKLLPEVWARLQQQGDISATDPLPRVSWSRYAGCSMCPCSPGFIVQATTSRKSIHVTVK
jgi:hypothetical protein